MNNESAYVLIAVMVVLSIGALIWECKKRR